MTTPLDLTAAAGLFDMDGTLVDSTAVIHAIWTGIARDRGIDAEAVLAYCHGRLPIDTLRHVEPEISPDDLAATLGELERRELEEVDGIVEIPGARALLDSLALPWAVVTSATSALAVRRMRAAGLPVPDVLVSSDDVTEGKPSPEGYRRAARLLGIPPARCVAFDDAEPGLLAARASGARVVAVGDRGSTADHRVPDLTRVRIGST
jgi:sugar-phosphatase